MFYYAYVAWIMILPLIYTSKVPSSFIVYYKVDTSLIADVPLFTQLICNCQISFEKQTATYTTTELNEGEKPRFTASVLCCVNCLQKEHVEHCCSEQCYTEFNESPKPIYLNASNLCGPDFISLLEIIQRACKKTCVAHMNSIYDF